jgi:hypothetical protein
LDGGGRTISRAVRQSGVAWGTGLQGKRAWPRRKSATVARLRAFLRSARFSDTEAHLALAATIHTTSDGSGRLAMDFPAVAEFNRHIVIDPKSLRIITPFEKCARRFCVSLAHRDPA